MPGRANPDDGRAVLFPSGRHVPEYLAYVVDRVVQRIDNVFNRRVIWQQSSALGYFITLTLWLTLD